MPLHVDDLELIRSKELSNFTKNRNIFISKTNSKALKTLVHDTIDSCDIEMPRLTTIFGFLWNKELDVFIFDFDDI